VFHVVGRDNSKRSRQPKTKTMKTKMLCMAATVLAAASLGQVALAGPPYPIHRVTSGPAVRAAKFVMDRDACKDSSCCATKLVPNVTFGGRASHSAYTKVRKGSRA
jgi:hypothetical protein